MDFKKRINRFLTASLVMLAVVCTAVFVLLSVYLQNRSQEAVRTVGEIYLEKVNQRLEMHYETMADFYLARLEVLHDECPVRSGETAAEAAAQLAEEGRSLGFSEVALINRDADIEYVFGA